MAGLELLAPEVMAVVCRHLPCSSLAAMECSCSALHRALNKGGVWGARARRVNQAAPYSCTTAMLEVARERGVEDQGFFKVILGVRKLIKTYGREIILAASFARASSGSLDLSQRRWETHPKVLIEKAYWAFVTKKVLRIKAWSPVNAEEAVVPGHHGRRLAQELLGGGEELLGGDEELLGGDEELLGGSEELLGGREELLGGVDEVEVAAVLARLVEEVRGRFDFEVQKAVEEVAKEIKALV